MTVNSFLIQKLTTFVFRLTVLIQNDQKFVLSFDRSPFFNSKIYDYRFTPFELYNDKTINKKRSFELKQIFQYRKFFKRSFFVKKLCPYFAFFALKIIEHILDDGFRLILVIYVKCRALTQP